MGEVGACTAADAVCSGAGCSPDASGTGACVVGELPCYSCDIGCASACCP